MAIDCELSAHVRYQNVTFSRLHRDEAFSNLYTHFHIATFSGNAVLV